MANSSTFIERARREQLVKMTIAQLAALGHARTSLARIAEAAGISKAAVLYHFASKDAVISAAYEVVIEDLVAAVGASVDDADPAERPIAYAQAMINYFAGHPDHARVIIESTLERGRDAQAEARWRPVADLLQAARTARQREPLTDARTAALSLGGAIDSIVAERLRDPDYDAAAAAATLAAWVDRLLDE